MGKEIIRFGDIEAEKRKIVSRNSTEFILVKKVLNISLGTEMILKNYVHVYDKETKHVIFDKR